MKKTAVVSFHDVLQSGRFCENTGIKYPYEYQYELRGDVWYPEKKIRLPFDCDVMGQYNDLYWKAVTLFGRSVTAKDDRIKIKTGRICLVLILSANEYKAYIQTFDVSEDVRNDDYYYQTMKATDVNTRIMDKYAIYQYLELKKQEDTFLKENEG